MSEERCPLGCMFYEEDDCCIDCGLCLANTEEETKIAQEKLNKYLKLSPQERADFMQKGAYFNEE